MSAVSLPISHPDHTPMLYWEMLRHERSGCRVYQVDRQHYAVRRGGMEERLFTSIEAAILFCEALAAERNSSKPL